MTTKKTIALFGAGSGLGAALAKRFGREGYQVALVARRAEPLEQQIADLAQAGVAAAAFPADLTDLAGIGAVVSAIEAHFGGIDVAVYAPVPANLGFVPAVSLDAATLQTMTGIFTYAPIEVAHSVLQGQLARGDGAIVLVSGLTSLITVPGLSGVGPAMAAARNYILTLNAEVAQRGVYAGSVNIGAMIARSAGMRIAEAGGMPLDENTPVIDPDVIAEAIWNLVTKRDRAEVILPAPTGNDQQEAK